MPDMVVFGKGAGNGYPLAGLVTSRLLSDQFSAGPSYFNTFGGNNVACASGLAVLDVLAKECLQDNSREVGQYLLHKLSDVKQAHPDVIGDVRGRGLFIGLEIVQTARSKAVSPGKAHWIKEQMKTLQVRLCLISTLLASGHDETICKCLEVLQVLMSADGVSGNVLKIKPPLVFTTQDADELVSKLEQVCSGCADHADAIQALNNALMSKFLRGHRAAGKYREELLRYHTD